jgi:hypothetical protein
MTKRDTDRQADRQRQRQTDRQRQANQRFVAAHVEAEPRCLLGLGIKSLPALQGVINRRGEYMPTDGSMISSTALECTEELLPCEIVDVLLRTAMKTSSEIIERCR